MNDSTSLSEQSFGRLRRALRSRWETLGYRMFGVDQRRREMEQSVAYSAERVWLVRPSRMGRALDELCDTHGSDKGSLVPGKRFPWEPHTYTDAYQFLFGPIRSRVESVLEVGIGTNDPDAVGSMGADGRPGASLRVWRDFFPRATVYGADIDRNILFSEERIVTGYLDQRDASSIRQFLDTHNLNSLDVIIDDGLHEFDANWTLFETVFPSLRSGGIYVVEDCKRRTLEAFTQALSESGHDWATVSLLAAERNALNDNQLVVIFKNS